MDVISATGSISALTQGLQVNTGTGTAPLGRLEVQAVDAQIVRVRLRPHSGYREPRTWAIAPLADTDLGTGTGSNTSSGAGSSKGPAHAKQVRADHLRNIPWEGRARDDLSGFNLPAVQCHIQAAQATLATSHLRVQVQTQPLRLTWQDTQGHDIASDRATSAYFQSGRTGAVRHYLSRDAADRYYGLGDKTGPLNLHGRRLRTLASDSLGYDPQHGDPLYKHWPFVLTRSAQGHWYGIYYDTLAECTFDLGCEHDNYHGLFRYVDIDDGDLDYYFIHGATPAEVIARYVQLIGGTALPPRWSLGFAQTAMGLADAPDAQQQLDRFIDTVASHHVPVSSFHYGSGYSSRGKGRYVFTWNADKFPDPKPLNQKFQNAGMRLVANIKPCLLDDHPNYAEVAALGGFVHDAQTHTPVLEQFWDGVGAHLDFSNKDTLQWWQGKLKQQVLDYHIDVGWNDNNEFCILNDAACCAGFGQPLPMHRARGLHSLLMTRATYEAQVLHQPGEAVYTISRGGSPGIQRYAQTWSGDNTTGWETLRWNIRTGLQMSLSGLFNMGHDVGGFAGPSPGPELLVRWVQACCLNPRMVMNSWKTDGSINLPWMHPSVTAEVLSALRLRYQLMPYLWQLFERAHTAHEPLVRPTFYDFAHDPHTFADCDDFMLGAQLLVAPVVEPGATTRRVYLPCFDDKLAVSPHQTSQCWYDFYSKTPYAAGQWHEVDAPLGRLPLFARHGAAIALAHCAPDRVPAFDDPVSEVRTFG